MSEAPHLAGTQYVPADQTTGKPGPLTAVEEAALRVDLADERPDALAPEERHLMRRVLATLDAAREQATAEADLRLLVMTTARDAAVVEADRLRRAATEARRDLDVDVLARAIKTFWKGDPTALDKWDLVVARDVAAEYRRLIEEGVTG